MPSGWIWWTIGGFLAVTAVYDLLQRRHAILRNFPLIGHLRYLLEMFGPELRQYIVTSNDEERPFSRDERRWVYASSKKENNYFGFGTDNDVDNQSNFIVIKHSAFPLPELRPNVPGYDAVYRVPCAKVLGEFRGRANAVRPPSIVNISGMSYGSLSAPAVEAINRGSVLAGCWHNTGEGGVTAHHQHGGELIWQLGTGYFGCRTSEGRFDESQFRDVVQSNPIRAIELKLSQGAKPGMGGLLPAAKITREISQIRGIPMGQDCASPSSHPEFTCVDSLLDFVERLADISGLPVGIKSAVGEGKFWSDLADAMVSKTRGVDFIAVDGGEGGTGAAPLVFCDHVALPFKLGFVRVYREFFERDLHHGVVFVGSGKLGMPESALLAFALGADLVHVGRGAMLAIGCIQAQRCHSGHCPAGVATQSRWLMRGLDPTLKSARLGNYVTVLRKELLSLSRASGVEHPGLVSPEQIEVLDDRFASSTVAELFNLGTPGWGLPSEDRYHEVVSLMRRSPAPADA